jgi:hypothetical protein
MGTNHRQIGIGPIIFVPAVDKAYIPGIILAILVILIVWLLLKMYRRLFSTQSRSNNTIVQSTTYKAGTDVRQWLEKFELYANTNNIYDKSDGRDNRTRSATNASRVCREFAKNI